MESEFWSGVRTCGSSCHAVFPEGAPDDYDAADGNDEVGDAGGDHSISRNQSISIRFHSNRCQHTPAWQSYVFLLVLQLLLLPLRSLLLLLLLLVLLSTTAPPPPPTPAAPAPAAAAAAAAAASAAAAAAAATTTLLLVLLRPPPLRRRGLLPLLQLSAATYYDEGARAGADDLKDECAVLMSTEVTSRAGCRQALPRSGL